MNDTTNESTLRRVSTMQWLLQILVLKPKNASMHGLKMIQVEQESQRNILLRYESNTYIECAWKSCVSNQVPSITNVGSTWCNNIPKMWILMNANKWGSIQPKIYGDRICNGFKRIHYNSVTECCLGNGMQKLQ